MSSSRPIDLARFPDRAPGQEIVITGMGAVCALGSTVPEIWENLLSGKSGVGPVTGFDAGAFGLAAQVKNLDEIKSDIPPQLAKTMGKHLSLLLKSTDEAYRHAVLAGAGFAPGDVGFFTGMGMVDYHVEDLLPAVLKSLSTEGELDYDKFFSRGYQEIYPLWSLGMLNNVAFCQAAIHFGIRGENLVLAPHGDSGIMALAEAVNALREGRALVALAGGVSEEVSAPSLARAALNGLSNESVLGDSVGLPLGEGSAMLVCEPLSPARKRGIEPLAAICGFGFSCARESAGSSPHCEGLTASMQSALSQAGLGPEQIDVVMLGSWKHREESRAIDKVFCGEEGTGPILVSAIPALGELLAAGPILNAIIGIRILNSGTVPEAMSVKRAGDNDFSRGGMDLDAARVLINTVSYEGQCASFVIKKCAC